MSDLNYTVAQEAELKTESPMNWETATAWGEANGKSARSVVAKLLSLKLDYVSKPVPAKAVKAVTKAELVAQVAESLKMRGTALAGLEKATVAALTTLNEALAA